MRSAGGLNRVLRLLEDAYGAKADERFEEKQSEFMSYRRLPGQSVAAYLATLKRLRTEYLKEDPGSVISDRAFAQRMLSRAALTRRERYDVFFAAGGAYKSADIERVLRFRCSQLHLDERKPTAHREDRTAPIRRPPPRKSVKRTDRRGPYKPTRHTHWADAEDDWEYDDEEDSFGDPDNEDLKPSWQKKTCRKKRHMKMMRATTMMMTRTWTRWIEVPSKKLSPPAGQPSPRRPNNAKAVATREMASQKIKERARANDHQIPGLPMPGRRTPPVPAAANEAIGRAMRYAQMSAQVKMQFTRSGTMRPISIRALTRGSVIPQQDPPGQ